MARVVKNKIQRISLKKTLDFKDRKCEEYH